MNEAGFVERRLKREERKWVSSCVPAAGRAFPPPVDSTAGEPWPVCCRAATGGPQQGHDDKWKGQKDGRHWLRAHVPLAYARTSFLDSETTVTVGLMTGPSGNKHHGYP